MSDSAADILLPRFQFLIDQLGFRIVTSEKSSSFDNMYIELTDDLINVRVCRERGLVSVELSPQFSADSWVPLGHLFLIVVQRDPVEKVTIEEQAGFLQDHYPEIHTMLSSENLKDTIVQVRQLGKARRSKLFPGSVGDA